MNAPIRDLSRASAPPLLLQRPLLAQRPLLERASELSELTELSHEPGIVMLSGAPGVGKTRLALELCAQAQTGAQAQTSAPHRNCYWVDLQRSPSNWVRFVAEQISQNVAPELNTPELIRAAAAQRINLSAALVVLDNFEPFVSDAEGLLTLSSPFPQITWLVTTRLMPERLMPGTRHLTLEPMGRDASLRYLTARLSEHAMAEIGPEVVERVERFAGGIPLAGDVASQTLALLGLDEGLSLLESAIGNSANDRTARIVSKTFDLLTPHARKVLIAAAANNGPFTVLRIGSLSQLTSEQSQDAINALRLGSLVHASELDTFNLFPLVRDSARRLFASEVRDAEAELLRMVVTEFEDKVPASADYVTLAAAHEALLEQLLNDSLEQGSVEVVAPLKALSELVKKTETQKGLTTVGAKEKGLAILLELACARSATLEQVAIAKHPGFLAALTCSEALLPYLELWVKALPQRGAQLEPVAGLLATNADFTDAHLRITMIRVEAAHLLTDWAELEKLSKEVLAHRADTEVAKIYRARTLALSVAQYLHRFELEQALTVAQQALAVASEVNAFREWNLARHLVLSTLLTLGRYEDLLTQSKEPTLSAASGTVLSLFSASSIVLALLFTGKIQPATELLADYSRHRALSQSENLLLALLWLLAAVISNDPAAIEQQLLFTTTEFDDRLAAVALLHDLSRVLAMNLLRRHDEATSWLETIADKRRASPSLSRGSRGDSADFTNRMVANFINHPTTHPFRHSENPLNRSWGSRIISEVLAIMDRLPKLQLDRATMTVHYGATTVNLEKFPQLWRVILALAGHPITAGTPSDVSSELIFQKAWPDENYDAKSSGTRIRTAIYKLRKMGLGELILSDGHGYHIDHTIRVTFISSDKQ